MSTHGPTSAWSLAKKIHTLLAARGLTVADVSRRSRDNSLHGRPGHIPHNLYDAIRHRQFTPSVFQLATLSRLSGYKFVDWLQLFGFSLDEVPRFQALLPAIRTVELDSRLYHARTKLPWFQDVTAPAFASLLVPLSQWLTAAEPRYADSLAPVENAAFRFVKIGSEDAFAFPELLPGSIVRVKTLAHAEEHSVRTIPSRDIFLVRYGRGVVCSQLYLTNRNHIVLSSRHLPYASVELQLGVQAAILGIADMEIRRTATLERAVVPASSYRVSSAPLPLLPARNVGAFLQQARRRSGLSFRDASARTRVVARTLRDARYFCAAGSLSDYETRSSPPRHLHKMISMCAVYFASVGAFLEAAGIALDAPGLISMPAEFLEIQDTSKNRNNASSSFACMQEIEQRFRPLPYFLYPAAADLFGLPNPSVRDVFWAGGAHGFGHPAIKGAAFLVLDRKKKRARSSLSCPNWAQPLYVFLRRDGDYLCGTYRKMNGVLVVHTCIAGLPKLLRLRERIDVEIVGRIVGVVRRLKRIVALPERPTEEE